MGGLSLRAAALRYYDQIVKRDIDWMNTRQPIYLTAEGARDLHQELDHLVKVKRPALADRLHRAIQQGDLSENADYIAAKEEQGFLEGRIQQIEATLRNAVVIERDGPSDEVAFGTHVTVVEQGVEEEETFRIVGPVEADPIKGNVSNESPLGQALIGRRVGDTVTVEAPVGEIVFQIVAIQ
jgi:transcription elongation factor GreA